VYTLHRWFRTPRRGPERHRFRNMPRRGSRMLVLLVPVGLCGCQSMHGSNPPASAPPAASAGAAAAQGLHTALAPPPRGKTRTTTEPAQDRSSFPNKLTREQEYNAHIDLGRFQESQENYELALGEYVKALEISESRSPIGAIGKNAPKQALAHR